MGGEGVWEEDNAQKGKGRIGSAPLLGFVLLSGCLLLLGGCNRTSGRESFEESLEEIPLASGYKLSWLGGGITLKGDLLPDWLSVTEFSVRVGDSRWRLFWRGGSSVVEFASAPTGVTEVLEGTGLFSVFISAPLVPHIGSGVWVPSSAWRVLGRRKSFGFGPHTYPFWVGVAGMYIPDPWFPLYIPPPEERRNPWERWIGDNFFGIDQLWRGDPALWETYRIHPTVSSCGGIYPPYAVLGGECVEITGPQSAVLPLKGAFFGEGGTQGEGLLLGVFWEGETDLNQGGMLGGLRLYPFWALPATRESSLTDSTVLSLTTAVETAQRAIPAYREAFSAYCSSTYGAWQEIHSLSGGEVAKRPLRGEELDRVLGGPSWRGPCATSSTQRLTELLFTPDVTVPGATFLAERSAGGSVTEAFWSLMSAYHDRLFYHLPLLAIDVWSYGVVEERLDRLSGEAIGDPAPIKELVEEKGYYFWTPQNLLFGDLFSNSPLWFYRRLGRYGEPPSGVGLTCGDLEKLLLPQLEARLRSGCRLYFVPPEAQEAEISRLSTMTGVDPRWYRVMARVYRELREAEEAILGWKP